MTTWADSSTIYSWGQVFNSTEGRYSVNATVMACNETIEAVDVQTVLYGRNYSISADTVPQPNEASVRMSVATYKTSPPGDVYQGLLSNGSRLLVDPFFDLLTISRQGISFEDLGNISKFDDVVSAIRLQHGIIRAQFANFNMRDPVNWEPRIALPDRFAPSDERNHHIIYPAKMEIPKAQLCIIQDPTATRILEGLLSMVIVLILVAKLFQARTDILPSNARSIASVLALIAGGNLFQFLHTKGVETTDMDEFAEKELFVDGHVCWLGWKKVKDSEDGETARYGIWILTPQEVSEAENIQKEKIETIKEWKRRRWNAKRSSAITMFRWRG